MLTLLFYLYIRQMGALADCFRHVQKQSLLHTGELQGWKGYIQSELADTVELTEKTCRLFGLDFEETKALGAMRDREKSEEYLRRHPDDFWV